MNQIDAMRTFIRVIQSGSFSAAAREMNTSQATVSKKIAALEKELGIKLIMRSSRELSLTTNGAKYYEHCISILGQLDEMEYNMRSETATPKGLLRIATSTYFSRMVLAPLIAKFIKDCPGIEVDMLLSERHVDLISEGIDVAIRARKLEDSSLIAIPLSDNPMIVVASPDYLSANGEPKTPKDLRQHNCISYKQKDNSNQWIFSNSKEDTSVLVSGSFRSDSCETNLVMALANIGITQLPLWAIQNELNEGRLVQVLKSYSSNCLPLNLIYAQNSYIPSRVRCFIDFLKGEFEK
ncbi:MAG: LysR substrate-binding domain-containing protein [Aestuariibacter sp.]